MRRLLAICGTVAAATATALPLTIPASASTTPHAATMTRATAISSGQAATTSAIHCSDPIYGPFLTGSPGAYKIEVEATTNCSAAVSHIVIYVELDMNGSPVATRTCGNYARSSLTCSVSQSCPSRSNYYWQGFSGTTAYLPPGYTPPTLSGYASTARTTIQC